MDLWKHDEKIISKNPIGYWAMPKEKFKWTFSYDTRTWKIYLVSCWAWRKVPNYKSPGHVHDSKWSWKDRSNTNKLKSHDTWYATIQIIIKFALNHVWSIVILNEKAIWLQNERIIQNAYEIKENDS